MADTASISERSYGIILIRAKTSIQENPVLSIESTQVLLVYQKTLRKDLKFYWGFPKGHPEEGDISPKHTAIRELQEETGISINLDDIRDLEDVFQTVHINPVTGKPKASRFWVARLRNEQDVKILEMDIAYYRWCGWDEAMDLLTFDDLKRLLGRAKEVLASSTNPNGCI